MTDKITILILISLALVAWAANYIHDELSSDEKSEVFEKPNRLIIIASLVLAPLLFYASTIWIGVWHEFLINLSASVVSVGVAVLLVDILREYHLERQYRIPRNIALNRIKASNSAFAINLATKNSSSRPEIFQALYKHIDWRNNQASIEALRSLSDIEPQKILENYTLAELDGTFKNSLEHIKSAYTDISAKYSFSFNGINFRTEYIGLMEDLDAVVNGLAIVAVGENEMQRLFKQTDPENPMTINYFMGITLIKYIKSYVAFVDKYCEEGSTS